MAKVPKYQDIKKLAEEIRGLKTEADKRTSGSLPERIKPATVISRVYVDESVADEDIATELLGALNQLYVAYVFTALGLESYVDSARSVEDITSLVATESLQDPVEMVEKNTGEKVNVEVSTEAERGDVKSLEQQEQRLLAGRVIEMTISNEAGGETTVRVIVQLIPRIITEDVAGAFFGLNIPTSAKRRFKQVLAGEISFIKDFLFALDRIKQHRENLKEDKTGDFKEMMDRQNNSLLKYWMNLSTVKPNYNSASSILVLDKNTFQRMLTEQGAEFDEKMKSRFFAKSLMMMLVVVDTSYNVVDLYTAGISDKGTYSFDIIEKVGSSKGKGMDLKDVMAVFGRGNNARL